MPSLVRIHPVVWEENEDKQSDTPFCYIYIERERLKYFLSANSADIRVALPPKLGKKSCRFFPAEVKIFTLEPCTTKI